MNFFSSCFILFVALIFVPGGFHVFAQPHGEADLSLHLTESNDPRPFDIVFNEIMADPSPTVGLPASEYVELYNRSGKTFQLEGWSLKAGDRTYTLPGIFLSPYEYLLIVPGSQTGFYEAYGRSIGIFTSSGQLANSGAMLQLFDQQGTLVSWVQYSNVWYGDVKKQEGGWSLEQIDPDNPCGGKMNWTASSDPSGGTPGRMNSVVSPNPDTEAPRFLWIEVPDDTTVFLIMNEPVDGVNTLHPENFMLYPSGVHPVRCSLQMPDFSVIRLNFSKPLLKGRLYSLAINPEICDCAGNVTGHTLSVEFSIPEVPRGNDIIINEILFDAYPYGSDYIELVNRSPHFFSLSGLTIEVTGNDGGSKSFRITPEGYLFGPSAYLLVCSDQQKVVPFYITANSDRVFTDQEFIQLNDRSGKVTLYYGSSELIDEMVYDQRMHDMAIRNPEGVSLERVDMNIPSMDPGNWMSAAGISGFGTPGCENSQHLEVSLAPAEIEALNEFFSPNGDGVNDLFSLHYQFHQPANRVTCLVFNMAGGRVRNLMDGQLLGITGNFSWDGTNDQGMVAASGLYLVFVRLVRSNGYVREYKFPCTLTRGR